MAETKPDGADAVWPPIATFDTLGSAQAPMVAFDEVGLLGVIAPGVGEIALAASRYGNAYGPKVAVERILVAHLRSNLEGLRTLKHAVDTVLGMLEAARDQQLAGEKAMAILRDAVAPEITN